MSIHGPFEITIREHHQANQAFWWHPTRRPLAHHATTDERTALALGLRILRAQRNHYRQSRPAWACWCGLDTPLLKTDQCADHAPSGAYMSDRW